MATKTKSSLKQRLAEKRKDLSKKGKGNILFLKEGTVRVRILPVGEEKDFAMEVTQFYLGQTIKGVYSPSTFGEPCPILELYEELKNSKKTADKNFAKNLVPKKKYLVPVILFKDDKGKVPDTESGIKLLQITGDLYGELIDSFLDPEWGDFTSPTEGYDIKFTRVGSGKNDTVYTLRAMPKSVAPKGFNKPVDLEAMVREVIPPYEDILEKLAEFQASGPDEEEEEKPVKRASKKGNDYEDEEEEEKPKKKFLKKRPRA